MKKILVPMDFSPESFYALDIIKEISQHYTFSEITLFHVIDAPTRSTFSATGEFVALTMDDVFVLKMIEKTRERMSEIISDSKFDDLDMKIKIKIGNHHRDLAEEITAMPSDLIVMGTTETTGVEEFLIGSTAEKVVRLSNCPVMTVKARPENFKIEEMVFASSFKEEIPAFEKLKDLQNAFNARLHLLFVNTTRNTISAEKAQERMESFAKKNELINYTINIEDAPTNEKGISRFAAKNNVDIIAMATHARKGFLHFVMGSLTENLVNHSKTPMFTFHMHEEHV